VKKKQMSFWVNEEMRKALRILAFKHNESMSLYIEKIFLKHLKEQLSYGNIKKEDYEAIK